MEDCLSQRVQLVPTVHTRITLATRDPVELRIYNGALRAGCNVAVSILKDSVQAHIIVREIFVKLFNRVSHVTSKYRPQNTSCLNRSASSTLAATTVKTDVGTQLLNAQDMVVQNLAILIGQSRLNISLTKPQTVQLTRHTEKNTREARI